MLTRLGIAAALMNDPELLILDEPTSGLDPAGRKQTIELIRELSGRDRTIIIATHILGDVERVCTDVGIISSGRLIYSGPMAEMRRLARQGTISVEIEGNTAAFEQQIPTLDELGSVRYERLGSEFRITFLGTEPLPEYVERVLQLVDRTGVELLHINTGADEIEEAFLRRLEEDRTRGFLRAAAWAATLDIAKRGPKIQSDSETADASIPGHPAL
jgi:ABC-type multidrug transport system ATPase subunit